MYFLNALQCRLIMAFGVSSAWGRVLIFAGWGLCKLQNLTVDIVAPSQQPIISEVRFRAIFEQINVGICQADLDGYLVDANPGLCHMLGYSHDELVHPKVSADYPPRRLKCRPGRIRKAAAGSSKFHVRGEALSPQRRHAIWVALTVCLVARCFGTTAI